MRDFPLLGSLDVIARLPQSRLFALAETKLGPEYDVQLTCLGLLLPVDELRHAVKVMERKARATTGAERLTELRLRLGDDDILAFRNYVSLVRSLSREERADGDCLVLAARSFLAGRWMGPEVTEEQNQTRRSSMQFALGSPAHARQVYTCNDCGVFWSYGPRRESVVLGQAEVDEALALGDLVWALPAAGRELRGTAETKRQPRKGLPLRAKREEGAPARPVRAV